MTSAEGGQVRRGVVMVGPPYLYNGAQVCGRRASRTCIFLLASFGAALTMIGLVFLTADLKMESGLWAAGMVCILLGVVLLVWFLTLCCAARCAFKALPASHPARVTPSAPVLLTPRSSTYQLLPMTPTRTQVTPISRVSATQTQPVSASQRASGYPTWGHDARSKEYMARQVEWQPSVYASTTTPVHAGGYQRPRGYPHDSTMTEYHMSNPLTAHTLCRPLPAFQPRNFGGGYSMTLPSTHTSPTGYVADDKPPPYHTVVSDP